MTVCAIMQPTYLPYLGYMHLIAASDVFVFLDDVQFARRSWQSRNRIMGAGGEVMLTVPVKKADRDAAIKDIEVAENQPWRAQHLNSIRHTYAKRPHFAEGFAFLEEHLAERGGLSDMNCALIEAAARKVGLGARFVRASSLGCPGHRSDHLLAICKAVGADSYLSPTGSSDYMEEEGVFADAKFPYRFQGFVEVAYPQGREPFTPYMAFIDAVMNVGWQGLTDLLGEMLASASGRREV